MLNMTAKRTPLLNRLVNDLPEGLIVDSAWLEARGIASNLRAYYVRSGWLEQPARGVYRKPRGELKWEQVVVSLQTLLLDRPFVVGGRTALELQGFTHYVPQDVSSVHLYGPDKPPPWLWKLKLPQRFVFHNGKRLFRNAPVSPGIHSLALDIFSGETREDRGLVGGGVTSIPWGQWDWPLTLSQPERAYLEMLDELPERESFHHADLIMEGAANFSPRRLQKLLVACSSVKVKRLFFFFADRHAHSWRKYLDKTAIDFGTGKRMLVVGGRLDPDYLITVPAELRSDA